MPGWAESKVTMDELHTENKPNNFSAENVEKKPPLDTHEPLDEIPQEETSPPPKEPLLIANVEFVVKQALTIFDATNAFHQMEESSKAQLKKSAFFSSIQFPTKKEAFINAIHQLIETSYQDIIKPGEVNLIIAITGLTKNVLKKDDLVSLHIPPGDDSRVLILASILRIAFGLDASNTQSTKIQNIQADPSGIWLVVNNDSKTFDIASATKNATLWKKCGYPKVNILTVAEAEHKLPPYPAAMESPGIQPTDPLSEAGRKVMLFQFAEMLKHEDACILGEDIEAVHDMRVATRRIRAAFIVFESGFKKNGLKPYLKGLKTTASILGTVRDYDVFIEKANLYIESLPESEGSDLDILIDDWKKKRALAHHELVKYLKSHRYHAFKRKFNLFLNSPFAGAIKPPKRTPRPYRVQEEAPMLIYSRLAQIRSFDSFLENASIEMLHALRIEFKKFRYTVEYFREVLGPEAKPVIKELKTIQDHLGDLHDAQVAIQMLRNFLDEWEVQQANLPIVERKNLEAVVTYLATRHAELHRLMTTFNDLWLDFHQEVFNRNLALAISRL